MSKPKNQNSILVLATLGVYLGLVLVGATPQVLAQAAMTRQFNVKDEVEVKDDLDKKPDTSVTDEKGQVLPETDKVISRSVDRFLTEFTPSTCSTPLVGPVNIRRESGPPMGRYELAPGERISLITLLAVTDLPRAGLDPLFAINGKVAASA